MKHAARSSDSEVLTGADDDEANDSPRMASAISDDSILWQLEVDQSVQDSGERARRRQGSSSSLASGSSPSPPASSSDNSLPIYTERYSYHGPSRESAPLPQIRPPGAIPIPVPRRSQSESDVQRQGTGSMEGSPSDLVASPPAMPQSQPIAGGGSAMSRTQSSAAFSSASASPPGPDFHAMLSSDSLAKIDETSTHDFSELVREPQGFSPWGVVSQFREPEVGEKNLFVYWGGSEPGPLVGSFMNTIIRNAGEFKVHIITDQNKQNYMTMVVDGKQIAPDYETREPADTHISWEVYDRVLSPGRLPIATQHDFIVNTMVAIFGGVYMDPGLLGPGKLDYWWNILDEQGANYLNYADGPYRQINVGPRHTKVEIDKEGVGKWGGDMWLDTFFTMAKADAAIMKCFLYLTANNPDFGPKQTQINKSLYFIYGGDVFDSCFASVYEAHFPQQVQGLPSGVNIYPERPSFLKKQQSAPNLSEAGSSSGQIIFTQKSKSSPRMKSRRPSKRRALVSESYREALGDGVNGMLYRMLMNERLDDDETVDPPSVSGIKLPFSHGGKGILLDQYEGEEMIYSNIIPRDRYDELTQSVTPDFDTMFEQKHSTALMVQKAINLLVTPGGGIYLKFYGTGTASNRFRLMTWEQLCGPPITFIMYLQKSITGWDVCTGTSSPIAKKRTLPRMSPLILRAPPPPLAPDLPFSSRSSSPHSSPALDRPSKGGKSTPPSPILKPSSTESSPSMSSLRKSVSFDSAVPIEGSPERLPVLSLPDVSALNLADQGPSSPSTSH